MKQAPFNPRFHNSRRGTAMLAVLALIALLGIAFMSTLRVMSIDIKIVGSKINGLRALQNAEKGIAVASLPKIERDDPLLHFLDPENGDGFDVKIITEGARFNINDIVFRQDKELLSQIFISWGVELDLAKQVADTIFDWVDSNDEVLLNGAERDIYNNFGRLNQPFNRPFHHLDEMRMVLGMEKIEAINPNWRKYFTLWSQGPLDINEAPAELIALAANVSAEQAAIIPENVQGPDKIRGTSDDVPFQNIADALELLGIDSTREDIAARFSIHDETTRLESIGQSSTVKRKINLVLRNRGNRPMILERTEEIIP